MGEKRLIEITTAINNADGYLSAMVYITSLESSEVYLLLRYISSSKYQGMNLLNALMVFSRDYLKSKGLYELPKNVSSEEELKHTNTKK